MTEKHYVVGSLGIALFRNAASGAPLTYRDGTANELYIPTGGDPFTLNLNDQFTTTAAQVEGNAFTIPERNTYTSSTGDLTFPAATFPDVDNILGRSPRYDGNGDIMGAGAGNFSEDACGPCTTVAVDENGLTGILFECIEWEGSPVLNASSDVLYKATILRNIQQVRVTSRRFNNQISTRRITWSFQLKENNGWGAGTFGDVSFLGPTPATTDYPTAPYDEWLLTPIAWPLGDSCQGSAGHALAGTYVTQAAVTAGDIVPIGYTPA